MKPIASVVLLAIIFHACGTGGSQQPSSEASTDSLRFIGEQQCMLRWKHVSGDSAMACVARAEAIAQRMDAPWATEKTEEMRAELLIARNDTAAIGFCRNLLETRRSAGPRALGNAHLLLGEAYNAWARYPEAITEFDQARSLAQEHELRKLLLNTLTDQTAALNNAGRSQQAVALASPYLMAHPDSGWLNSEVRMMSNLGAAYYLLSRMDSAAYWLDRTIALKDVLSDTAAWIGALANRASIHTMQGDYVPALDLLLQAKQLANRTRNGRREAEVGYNLATIYEPLRRVEDAYLEVMHASRLADSLTLPQLRPRLLMAEAMLAVQFDSIQSARHGLDFAARDDRAIPQMQQALEAFARNGDHLYTAVTEAALGDMLILQKRPSEAKPLIEHALAVYSQFGYPTGIITANMGLGNVHFDLGELQQAEPYYTTALAGLEQVGMKEYKAHVLDRLHTIYARKGQLAKALSTLELAKEESDRLRADSSTKAIADLEARFVFAKKEYADSLRHASQVKALADERAIADLKSQRANTRAVAVGGGTLLLLIGGSIAYRSDRKRRQALHEKQTAQLRQQASELENRALRAQMDPHFISNTLNAVNSSLYTDDVDAASSLLVRFAEWIRTMLETSRHDSIALADEFAALTTYLELERSRTGGKFVFHLEAEPDLPTERVLVPPLIIQPFLENAIEHGFRNVERGGIIHVSAREAGGSLRILITDNGGGLNKAETGTAPKKTSLSSTITQERLRLLEERTGKPASYTIQDNTPGTRVEIVLPLEMS